MNQIIPIQLLPGALPAGINANPQAYYEVILAATRAQFDASGLLLGKIGGEQPTTNKGPWLKTEKEWWVWDEANHTYVPMSNELEIGDMIMTHRTDCDSAHWLFCDGREISRNEPYDKLFLAIGTNYGVGNGSTTFNLPNTGSRVMIGVGIGKDADGVQLSQRRLYEQGGLEQVALELKNTPPHTHSIKGEYYDSANKLGTDSLIIDDNHAPTKPRTWDTQSTGGNADGSVTPHNNMMPWMSVLLKIKWR